jgi:probable O-glycosylation ligase (exosortase A-associated)
MVFTFILLLAPQERIPALAPFRIAMVSGLAALVLHVVSRLSRGLPVIAFTPAVVCMACLVGWAVVTIPFSYWPGGSVAFLLGEYLKPVVIFVLLANAIDRPALLKQLAWGLVLMTVPLAVVTLENFLEGEFLPGAERVAGYASGLTGNPNDMALWLNLMLPLCAALFLTAQSAGRRLLLASMACLFVAAIVATFSRAGFLTLTVIALCYLWRLRARPERAWLLGGLILAVAALPFLPSNYVDRMSTIVDIEEDRSRSAQIRFEDTKAALRLGVKNPVVGAGVGMGALAMNEERGASWTEIHNVYLQLMVELGLPGVVLFLFLLGYCLRATGQVLRGGVDERVGDGLFHLAEGLRVSLIAFAVAALFHPVAYHFYFYYVASLAVAAGAIYQARSKPQAQAEVQGSFVKPRRL